MVTLPQTSQPPTDEAENPSTKIITTSPGALAMHAVHFRIAGDVINKAVASLPEEQRTALKWFSGYCRAKNLAPTEVAQLLRKSSGGFYSWDSIYQALTGRREGVDLSPLSTAIEQFREQVEGVTMLGDSGFIETRLSQIIGDRCQRSLKRGRITFIFGESQIGKSEALKHYQRTHNHGETIYVEVPTGGGIYQFLGELALALGIPTQQRQGELRRRLIDAFDQKMLLIVDEAHRCLRSRYGDRGVQVFDFLRELYNRKRTGIVISMTNEGRDIFKRGPNRVALAQLWKRRIAPLQLPDVPFADDLDKFARAYNLAPAGPENVTVELTVLNDKGEEQKKKHTESPLNLQNRVVGNEGLGVWLSLLQDAADIARSQRRAISWGAVIKAYCIDQAESEVIQ